ncbi:MAG: C39 family peptidase [bacterium]|nr:C39 family peptidase [bacterium]
MEPLSLDILCQPDGTTCGPTSLHAVYRYYGDDIPLEQVIEEVPCLEEGGTLAVLLACHALRRGYKATIITYNLEVFDPTWFFLEGNLDFVDRLKAQARHKTDPKLQLATRAYLEFFELGGALRLKDLTKDLIRKYLKRSIPILTGLSATYLYRCPREFGPNLDYDDIRGVPTGHFVILYGYNKEERQVLIADPYFTNPLTGTHKYQVSIERVICSIMLGLYTYDANLLIIESRIPRPQRNEHVDSDRRE